MARRLDTAPKAIPGRSSIGSEIYWLEVDKSRLSTVEKSGRESLISN